MRKNISISTHQREILVDITDQVKNVVRESEIQNGLVNVYAQGATAAIMIQENWDDSVQTDVVNLLQKLIPKGVWLHDAQDGRQRLEAVLEQLERRNDRIIKRGHSPQEWSQFAA